MFKGIPNPSLTLRVTFETASRRGAGCSTGRLELLECGSHRSTVLSSATRQIRRELAFSRTDSHFSRTSRSRPGAEEPTWCSRFPVRLTIGCGHWRTGTGSIPPKTSNSTCWPAKPAARQAATIDVSDPLIATLPSLRDNGPSDRTPASDLIDGLMARLSELSPLHRTVSADRFATGPRTTQPCSTICPCYREPPQSPDEIGRLGGYRILRLLGSGGMGVVLLAEDVQLGRPVALKILLRPSGRSDAENGFVRESAGRGRPSSTTTSSPSTRSGETVGVPYPGHAAPAGRDAGRPHSGRRTAAACRRSCASPGRSPTAWRPRTTPRLVHRDIKPSNVWLEADAEASRSLDFGLARTADRR